VFQCVLDDELVQLFVQRDAPLILTHEVLSLERIQTRRNLVYSLLRSVLCVNHATELLEVCLHLFAISVQRSDARTSRHEEIDITKQDERQHDAAPGQTCDFGDSQHFAAT
jgi:hypothetical protein